MAIEPVIKTKNLSVTYFLGRSNEVQALKKANIEIYPGEFIIFFGPSGCGKSTLLYAIAGLELNVQGDIFIQKTNLAKMTHEEVEKLHRQKIGMIFQAYYLIYSLSVLNNVILPQIFISGGEEKRRKDALALLERFGLKNQVNKRPNELSGGQQQRVAICRALINNPEVLLADEPVGNLDSASADEVMKLLVNLNEREKKTIVLVTHNPEHLKYAHRIFYMKDGEVIDTKVNKVVDRRIEGLIKSEAETRPVSREMELLLRTYSNLSSAQVGSLLLHFKARQIVMESLVGMTEEEIEKIQKMVEKLLLRGEQNPEEISEFLDLDTSQGGVGMHRFKAEAIAGRIKEIIGEIKLLEKKEKTKPESGAVKIRKYLLDSFDIRLRQISTLKVFDRAIAERLENRMDTFQFQKIIDRPVARGGVGLDKRIVKKVARRLELLILGKYK